MLVRLTPLSRFFKFGIPTGTVGLYYVQKNGSLYTQCSSNLERSWLTCAQIYSFFHHYDPFHGHEYIPKNVLIQVNPVA